MRPFFSPAVAPFSINARGYHQPQSPKSVSTPACSCRPSGRKPAEFGMAFDLLMGYAVAHEVGHCLLGPGHSYAELMRGAWNPRSL